MVLGHQRTGPVLGAALYLHYWLKPRSIALSVGFQALSNVIFDGLGLLETLLQGGWWLGIGPVLRGQWPGLGTASVILGIVALVSALGSILRLQPIAMLGALSFFLSPLWALWLCIAILRSAANRA